MRRINTRLLHQPLLARLGGALPSLGSVILFNAFSLFAATVGTSALGVVYWFAAARLFPQSAVGLASAAVSAMTLVAVLGSMGYNTFVLGEVQRDKFSAPTVAATGMTVAAAFSAGFAALYLLAAPSLTTALTPLARALAGIVLFGVGSAIAGALLVSDQALTGAFKGSLQLWRNMIFATVKLLLVLSIALVPGRRSGTYLFGTWVLAMGISAVALAGRRIVRPSITGLRPTIATYARTRGPALAHHGINLSLRVPALSLPIIVIALTSTRIIAAFYIAWTVAGLEYMIPTALTSVLFASSSAEPDDLGRQMFLTLSVSTLGVIAFNVVVQPLSFWLLLIFGHGYAREASTVLRLLSLVGFPYVIKNHYVALCRARGKLLSAAGILSGSAAIELLFAVIGGVLWGVNGVAAGWASAVAVEAVLMTKPVIQATQWPTIRHR